MNADDTSPLMDDIVEREREFHNNRFSQDSDPREFLDKWYRTIKNGADAQDEQVIRLSKNADVMEYGCSDGGLSIDQLRLPRFAKSLSGIDISDVAIAKANDKARLQGHKNSTFYAMDAQNMTFKAESFDLVFGRGIIHHLDLDLCYADVCRVLRPGGRAVFYEPMGHNPVLNLYRARTPEIRTPDEHPLLVADFKLAKKYFSGVSVTYFGLATVLSAVVPGTAGRVGLQLGHAADAVLLNIPFIRRFAWYALITLQK
ncbi:class I SAM-dependent methyltransferase [Neorhizobium sp. NCHU2750]|uniref:class I SAM-dependent methyltransferase n=1 Tax=Neorhizobium sp. NCHU2750 TaxID=1825976 RepID=UPI000EB71D88|nr:methyltransferase type 11 [Neorhizobium sp. NCHU2750]